MVRRGNYFPVDSTSPEPLVANCERRVRFEEVDSIGIVWHGRYPSYFEDARIAFGDKYGLSYQSFIEHSTVAPIAQMHIDYILPLRFDEIIRIESQLHWSDAARLNFSYSVYNKEGSLAATGYTVQLMTEPNGTMLLVIPGWLMEFRRHWKEGRWESL